MSTNLEKLYQWIDNIITDDERITLDEVKKFLKSEKKDKDDNLLKYKFWWLLWEEIENIDRNDTKYIELKNNIRQLYKEEDIENSNKKLEEWTTDYYLYKLAKYFNIVAENKLYGYLIGNKTKNANKYLESITTDKKIPNKYFTDIDKKEILESIIIVYPEIVKKYEFDTDNFTITEIIDENVVAWYDDENNENNEKVEKFDKCLKNIDKYLKKELNKKESKDNENNKIRIRNQITNYIDKEWRFSKDWIIIARMTALRNYLNPKNLVQWIWEYAKNDDWDYKINNNVVLKNDVNTFNILEKFDEVISKLIKKSDKKKSQDFSFQQYNTTIDKFIEDIQSSQKDADKIFEEMVNKNLKQTKEKTSVMLEEFENSDISSCIVSVSAISQNEWDNFLNDKTWYKRFDNDIIKNPNQISNIQNWARLIYNDNEISLDWAIDERTKTYLKLLECNEKLWDNYNLIESLQDKTYEQKKEIVEYFYDTYRELLVSGKYFVNTKIKDEYRQAFMDIIITWWDKETAKAELKWLNEQNIIINANELLKIEIEMKNAEITDIDKQIDNIEIEMKKIENNFDTNSYTNGKSYDDAGKKYFEYNNLKLSLNIEKYTRLIDICKDINDDYYKKQIYIEIYNTFKQDQIIRHFGQDVLDDIQKIKTQISEDMWIYNLNNDIISQFESTDILTITKDVSIDEYKENFPLEYEKMLDRLWDKFNNTIELPNNIVRIKIPWWEEMIVKIDTETINKVIKISPKEWEKIVVNWTEQIMMWTVITESNFRIASTNIDWSINLKHIDWTEDITISEEEVQKSKNTFNLWLKSINTPEFQNATKDIKLIQENYWWLKEMLDLFNTGDITDEKVDEAQVLANSFRKNNLTNLKIKVDDRKSCKNNMEILLSNMTSNWLNTWQEKIIKDYINLFDFMIVQFTEDNTTKKAPIDIFLDNILNARTFYSNDTWREKFSWRLKENGLIIRTTIVFAVATTIVTISTLGTWTPLIVVAAAWTLWWMIWSRIWMFSNELIRNSKLLDKEITMDDGTRISIDYDQPTDVELYFKNQISGEEFWWWLASEFIMGTVSTFWYIKAWQIIWKSIANFTTKFPNSRLTNTLKFVKKSFFEDLKTMWWEDIFLNSAKSTWMQKFYKEFAQELSEEAIQIWLEQWWQAVSDALGLPMDIWWILWTVASIWSCLNWNTYQKDFFKTHKITWWDSNYDEVNGIITTNMEFNTTNESELKNYFIVRWFECIIWNDGTLTFKNPTPLIEASWDKKAVTQEFILKPSDENLTMRSNDYFIETYWLEYDYNTKEYKYASDIDQNLLLTDLKKKFIIKENKDGFKAIDTETWEIIYFKRWDHILNSQKIVVEAKQGNNINTDQEANPENIPWQDINKNEDIKSPDITNNDLDVTDNTNVDINSENTVKEKPNWNLIINKFTDQTLLNQQKSELEPLYPTLTETRTIKVETKSIAEWMLTQGGYEIVMKDWNINYLRNTIAKEKNEVIRLKNVVSIGDANWWFNTIIKWLQNNSCIWNDIEITEEWTIEWNDSETWTWGDNIVVLAWDILWDRTWQESENLILRLLEMKAKAQEQWWDIIINFGNHEEFVLGMLLNNWNMSNYTTSDIKTFAWLSFIFEQYSWKNLDDFKSNDIIPNVINNKVFIETMRNDKNGKIMLEVLCQMPLIEQIDDWLFIHCAPSEKIADVFMQWKVPWESLQDKIDYINTQFSNYLKSTLLWEDVFYDVTIANEIFYNIVWNENWWRTNNSLSMNSAFYDYLNENWINNIYHWHVVTLNWEKTVITDQSNISVIWVDGMWKSQKYTNIDKNWWDLTWSWSKNTKTIDLSDKENGLTPSQDTEVVISPDQMNIEPEIWQQNNNNNQDQTWNVWNDINNQDINTKNPQEWDISVPDYTDKELRKMQSEIIDAKKWDTQADLSPETMKYKTIAETNSGLMSSDLETAIKKLESELIAKWIVNEWFTFTQYEKIIFSAIHEEWIWLFWSKIQKEKIQLFEYYLAGTESERTKDKTKRNEIRKYAMDYGYLANNNKEQKETTQKVDKDWNNIDLETLKEKRIELQRKIEKIDDKIDKINLYTYDLKIKKDLIDQQVKEQEELQKEMDKIDLEIKNKLENKTNENVLIPDWLKSKITSVHWTVWQWSIFDWNISVDEITNIANEQISKLSEDQLLNIATWTWIYSVKLDKPIWYNLVLPVDQVAQTDILETTTTQKIEWQSNIDVPCIKTNKTLDNYASNDINFVIRQQKDESWNVIPWKYIVLSIFPGTADIPRASERDGKYAVIIPKM